MSVETECGQCGKALAVPEGTMQAAREYANGSVRCKKCAGSIRVSDDCPSCDREGCANPGPFVVESESGEIRRCRNHMLIDLLENDWFAVYGGETA